MDKACPLKPEEAPDVTLMALYYIACCLVRCVACYDASRHFVLTRWYLILHNAYPSRWSDSGHFHEFHRFWSQQEIPQRFSGSDETGPPHRNNFQSKRRHHQTQVWFAMSLVMLHRLPSTRLFILPAITLLLPLSTLSFTLSLTPTLSPRSVELSSGGSKSSKNSLGGDNYSFFNIKMLLSTMFTVSWLHLRCLCRVSFCRRNQQRSYFTFFGILNLCVFGMADASWHSTQWCESFFYQKMPEENSMMCTEIDIHTYSFHAWSVTNSTIFVLCF